MYKTFIGLRTEEEKVHVKGAAKRLAVEDPSFRFRIRALRLPRYKWFLIAFSEDEASALRRADWMVTQVAEAGSTDLVCWVTPYALTEGS